MKISLCMIIKDEEKYIKQCLDNALPLVDDAIIVDTGSTDDTINIIEKSYKDKVKLIKHPWKNDFSEARNKSLEKANGDWILILDADEKLIFDKVKLIEQLNKENVDGYNIPMYNFLGIDNILYSAVMPRLLKNDNPKYIGAIHEQITLNGEPLKSLSTFDTSVCKIIHYGYLHENVIKKNKTERNISIIKDELKKDPEDGFQWYNLGVTYMGESKYGKAIDAFIESNKFSQKGRKTYHDSLVLNLAECLYREKSYKQLKNYLDALKEDNSIIRYPDYYYYFGKVFEKNKKYIKAIESYNKAVEIGEINNSVSKKGIGSFISNIEIARILVKQKKVNEAVMKYIEAIFYPDNFTYKGLEELKELLIKEKMQEVLVELEKMIEEKNKVVKDNKNVKELNINENCKYINDYEDDKQQVKKQIQSFIEQGLIKDAKKLLSNYENVVIDDIEIYSIKSVIAVMEGNMDEAFTAINEGLTINPNYVDLLYNKAYLLEQAKEYKESYKLYQDVLKNIDNEELKYNIENKLKTLKSLNPYANLEGKLSVLAINKNLNCDIVNYITNWVHEFGFTILKTIYVEDVNLNEEDINQYIFLYDLNPVNMSNENKLKFPNIDNERYFLINALEEHLSLKFGIKKSTESLYLTQNEKDAKEIVEKLFKEKSEELYREISGIELKYETQYPVVRLFNGFRHRAKTELIRYRDGLAVKKTWKPGNERFIKREKYACSELSKKISCIPKLIDSGENYIIIPYYENILHKDELTKKMILTTHIIDIANYFKELYEVGCFNPDIHPGQFVFSEKDGLKAIDFEYLQAYDQKPDLFIESYDIKGYPRDFKGDKPNYVGENLHKWYDELWVQYTGYNLEQIANLVEKGKYGNDDLEINKVLGLLNYAKTSGKSYNGSLYGSAYHSLKLKEYYFRGQRECNLRLQKVPYDFSSKTVLDIGCNAGGMLHAIADKIKMGVGIDYDYRLVNAANAVRAINKANNLSFYRFDLENEDIELIKNFMLDENEKIDICFLLSVCMWIKNWKDVISFVSSISNNLLFETNGTKEQQFEQIEELKKNYENIEVIEEESNDDPGQPNRKLLFCGNRFNKNIIVESNMEYYDKLLYKIIKPQYNIIYRKSTSTDRVCKLHTTDEEIDFKEYIETYFDNEFYKNYINLIENRGTVKGIITGLSYFEVGIDHSSLKKPFVNLALSSQDLFYDFAMIRHAIEDLIYSTNIEQVILGLSSYSFRYDLSMTQNPRTKEKPKVYYPIIKKLHNYSNKNEVFEKYRVFEKNFNTIFQNDYINLIFEYSKSGFYSAWDNMINSKFDMRNLTVEDKQREVYLAERWNENYPKTTEENIRIFEELLKYLEEKNINVVVVTNPVTDFYKNYFSENCQKEFNDIICNFQKEFKFTFIDGYNMNCFKDSDFYDGSHLNMEGAKKFTEIINKYL